MILHRCTHRWVDVGVAGKRPYLQIPILNGTGRKLRSYNPECPRQRTCQQVQIRLMRIESKDAQIFQLFQEFFQYIQLRDLRLRCGEVFSSDCFIDLVPMNRNVAWRSNTDFYTSGADIEDRYLYLIANDKAFIFFSRKY
jgi:hypothetical protein